MDFYHVIHGTTCNRKSNAIQNPKLTYPLRGNNADKRVYQTNSRRKRTEKNGTATLLKCGPPVIYQEKVKSEKRRRKRWWCGWRRPANLETNATLEFANLTMALISQFSKLTTNINIIFVCSSYGTRRHLFLP